MLYGDEEMTESVPDLRSFFLGWFIICLVSFCFRFVFFSVGFNIYISSYALCFGTTTGRTDNGKPHLEEEQGPHNGEEHDKRHIADIYGIPIPELPVDVAAHGLDRVQVTKVRHQQAEQKRLPDLEVASGSQNQGLVDAKQQIQIGKLGEDDGRRNWHLMWGSRGGMCQGEVGMLEVVGVYGANQGRDGFEIQEDETVHHRNGRRWCGFRHCRHEQHEKTYGWLCCRRLREG